MPIKLHQMFFGLIKKQYFLLFFCAIQVYAQIPSFNFYGKATIELDVSELHDSIEVSFYKNNLLGDLKIDGNKKTITSAGKKYFELPCQSPQKIDAYIDNQNVTMFIAPDDTLRVAISYSAKARWNIFYKGNLADENKYYIQKRNSFKGVDMDRYKIRMTAALDPFNYAKAIDSLANIEQGFLENYLQTQGLSKQFADYEKAEIKYGSANQKFHYNSYRVKKIELPKNYFSFISPLLKNDSTAVLSYEYYQFLQSMALNVKLDSALLASDKNLANKKFQKGILLYAQNILSGEVADVFLASSLNSLLISRNEQFFNDALADEKIKFNNKHYREFLEKKHNEKFTLKAGEDAPFFNTKDKKDKTVALKDYFGKPLYICFWREVTPEVEKEFSCQKALLEKYGITILNIAADVNPKQWQKVLSSNTKSDAVHLMLFGNWNNLTIDDYDIKAFPHIVLIDEKGKVVQNNAKKNEIEKFVSQYKK